MLSTADVAKLLGVSTRSVTRYAQRGLLRSKQFGGAYMFDPDDIDGFIPGRRYVDWDVRLREVSRVYREAKTSGVSHRRAIAEAFDVPYGSGTVDRWLLLARERGYIEEEVQT